MKTNAIKMMFLLIMVSSLAMVSGNVSENEDIQWIRDWTRTQRAHEVAALLQLTTEQVDTLTAMKAEVDAVNADFEQRAADLDAAIASAAAEVRARIEATGEFSDADRELLGSFKSERRNLAEEKRLNLQLATVGLRGCTDR